uniref:Activin types I and II receptor domain-containing protein n=1 Tax=Electrophorus electricus TaxID=8005 RepID=A0A4W4F7E0_ELEEL
MCFTTKVNCSVGDQCFVGTGKAGKSSVLDVKMLGCLPEEGCNKTMTIEFPANKTVYTMNMQCCNESYCNGGPAVLLPSFTVIALTVGQTIDVL